MAAGAHLDRWHRGVARARGISRLARCGGRLLLTRRDLDEGALRLLSGAPYWLLKAGLEDVMVPPSRATDVAIIGAGITGALVADALAAEGLAVTLIDRRTPAAGSTAACTALLQYETDTELFELAGMIGEQDAARAWQLCSRAIDRIEAVCRELESDCGFARSPSLYIASRRKHRRRLDREHDIRRRHGFQVERWSRMELESRLGFPGHGALWTPQAAVVDPVRLTRALLARALGRGAALLPRTTVEAARREGSGFSLSTNRGTIEATHLVYAMGYEVPPRLRREVVDLNSSFAFVTAPGTDLAAWQGTCQVWESARPYTYFRATPDRRIICGGADTAFQNADFRDAVLPRRVARLERRLERLLPGVAFEREFAWAGTFGETSDGLPYVGRADELDGAFVALGYGGNGITFSMVAADILRDLVLGRENDDAAIFRLDR